MSYVRLSFGGDPVRQVLQALADWGVTQGGSDAVSLTQLGVFACREFGLGPGEQCDPAWGAAELLAALVAAPQLGPRAATAWINARDVSDAADQLLVSAAAADPAGRLMAIMLVQELGEAALPAWQASVQDPHVGPYARHALWEADAGDEPELTDVAWMAVDLAAAIGTLGESVGGESAQFEDLMRHAFADVDPREAAALRAALADSGRQLPESTLALFAPSPRQEVAGSQITGARRGGRQRHSRGRSI